MMPTVSAIVPVHNGAAHVADALRSIQAQTHPVTELIVVDDGSTDESADMVRSVAPEAILIRQAQSGPANARNAGAARASGDLLGFLDHDDVWPADRTGELLKGHAATPRAGIVCGRIRVLEMPGAIADERRKKADGTWVPFFFQTLLVRRDVWLAAGGMRPTTLNRAEDLDLYMRLVDAGVEVARIDAITCIYRYHTTNRTSAADLEGPALLSALRDAIHRRRSSSN